MRRIKPLLMSMKGQVMDEAYPGAMEHIDVVWAKDPFHVLISTVLSQRTRDQNTYNASKALFARFDSPAMIASADMDELIGLVKPVGFPQAKAKAIKEICRRLHNDYDDKVPMDIEILLTFPMVGRKTANCVLSYGFGIPAICVDTHVHRISNRIGLVTTGSPDETEIALREIAPKELWCDINAVMIRFGQRICLPRKPKCDICSVSAACEFFSALPEDDERKISYQRTGS
ncbi:MAG: endonuclease III [Methanomassiliicoccales archaeon]|jgi:endonuclease-3